jgi:DNA repair exonuclease SbcCD ATPase subunit
VDLEKKKSNLDQARDIVNAVIISTLEEVRVFIEEAVTLCLETVYGSEYSFSLEYEVKRGKSEARVAIVKSGEKLNPRDEVGGGVIDVASIGLRFAGWILQANRSRPIFLFDEPFRFVSRDLTSRVVEMLHKICEAFNAQIIMVSHNDELIEGATRTLSVQFRPEGSVVSQA